MTIDPAFEPGARKELGSYVFTADAIIEFARQFDPQRFHVDAEAAKASDGEPWHLLGETAKAVGVGT